MQLGFVGLGKMGLNMVKRPTRGGHDIVAFDVSAERMLAALSNQFGGHAVKRAVDTTPGPDGSHGH